MTTGPTPADLPEGADLPPGWSHGWTFHISWDDPPRRVQVDLETVEAARTAARAMQEALLEAQRQSLIVDAAVASLVEDGAQANQIGSDVGLSMHTADDLVAGMPMLESVCRDGLAYAEGRRRDRR